MNSEIRIADHIASHIRASLRSRTLSNFIWGRVKLFNCKMAREVTSKWGNSSCRIENKEDCVTGAYYTKATAVFGVMREGSNSWPGFAPLTAGDIGGRLRFRCTTQMFIIYAWVPKKLVEKLPLKPENPKNYTLNPQLHIKPLIMSREDGQPCIINGTQFMIYGHFLQVLK